MWPGNILAFEARRGLAVGGEALKRFSERGLTSREADFYDMLDSHIAQWSQKDRQEFSKQLKDKFGFPAESRLLSFIVSGETRGLRA